VRQTTRGSGQAAAAMVLVGTLTAVSATISHYPVYGGQAVRYAVAAVILLVIAGMREPDGVRTRPRDWLLLTALAATGLAGFNVSIVEGTRYTSPATIGTVIGAVPIVLAIAAPLMAGRRPAPRVIVGAVIVTVGAGLANGLGGGSLTGLLLAVGALAGEVCFSLLALPLLPRLGPLRVSAYSTAAAVPLLLVAGLATSGGGVLRRPSLGEVGGYAYLSLVITAGAFVMWYDAIGRLGADRAALFAGLIPVSAVATTMALGLRAPNASEIAGAILVACGVVTGLRERAEAEPGASEKPSRGITLTVDT
jgi:drug/metabolite transporter (DMT)-like permease